MIKKHFCCFLILFLITSAGTLKPSEAQEAGDVRICYHEGEWPPYTFFAREDGRKNSSKVIGATVDLFNEVFKRIGIEHTITMMPWKRCLMEVTFFDQNNRYEMFINGSYNNDRADKYYITTALYKTHQGLFYNKEKFKTPPRIDSPADLRKYSICGILGYNYTMYRKRGVKNEIDKGALDIKAVLKKIGTGRCDFFPSPMEPILAGKKYGVYQYPDTIAAIRLPWAGTTTFHAFISKSSPRAFELYTKINQELQILQGTGESDKIFKKWLEGGDGL